MSLPKIGAVLALDGEREYKSAISSINSTQRALRSEMKLVTEAFYGQENSVDALTEKERVLIQQQEAQTEKAVACQAALEKYAQAQEEAGKKVEAAGELVAYAEERLEKLKSTSEVTSDEIQRQEKVVELAKSKLEVANREYDTASKKTAEWEVSLNQATAELLKTNRALNENENYLNEAKESADGHAKSIDGFGKTVKEAREESCKFNEVWSDYGKELVSLQKLEMTKAVLEQIGSAAIDTAKEAAAYADDILTMATNTGVAADTLQELKYAQDLMDVSLETVTGSMAKNIRSMNSAREGTEAYAEAYKKLGVEVEDVTTGELRNSEEVFWECIDALGTLENETERDAIAMQIFGRSAQELNSLVAQGSAGFAELAEEARESGYVLGEEALGQLGKTQDALDRFANKSTQIKNKIGAELGPVVISTLKKLGDKGDEIADLAINLGENVIPVVSEGLELLIENGETLIPVFAGVAAGIKTFETASAAVKAIEGFKTATEGANAAQAAFNVVANANPYVLLATAVVGVGAALVTYSLVCNDAKTETEKMRHEIQDTIKENKKFNDSITDSLETMKENRDNQEKSAGTIKRLSTELSDLNSKEKLTNEEQSRMRSIVAQLNQLVPELNLSIDEQTGYLEQTNEQVENLTEHYAQLARVQYYQEEITEIVKQQCEAEEELTGLMEKKEAAAEALALAEGELNDYLREQGISLEQLYDQMSNGETSGMSYVQAVLRSKEAICELDTQIQETNQTIEILGEEYNKTAEYIGDHSEIDETVDAVGNMAEEMEGTAGAVGEKAAEISEAFSGMSETIREAVQEQMDIFAEYEEKTAISGEKLIENMESQVEGIQSWGDNLNELAGRADENGMLISEGLLSHLVELGPEGAAYVQAFVNMTDEELQRANELWAESLTLPDTIAEQFAETGAQLAAGLVTGIEENTSLVEDAMAGAMDDTLKAANKAAEINSPSKKTTKTGEELDEGLAKGIRDNKNNIVSAMKDTTTAVLTTARTELASSVTMTIGEQFSAGLASGIRAGKSQIINAAIEVARAAISAARNELGIHSPSKVTEEMGGYYMEGWIQGVRAKTENLKDAVQGALSSAMVTEAVPAQLSAEATGYWAAGENKGETNIQIYFQPQQMTDSELDRAFDYVNERFGTAI